MEFQYQFIATINKPHAFETYVKANITWVSDYLRFENQPLNNSVLLFSSRELTPLELQDTTSKIDLYTDPLVSLVFDHTETTTMSTKFTSEEDLTMGGKKVLQTFIFSKPERDDVVLDTFKTMIEYNCPNTQDFSLVTNPSMVLEIYDITRDVQIIERTIPLNEIETKWKGMNMTPENDTVFRSSFFGELYYHLPNYDCAWQIRVSVSDPSFRVRLNSLQQIYYRVE